VADFIGDANFYDVVLRKTSGDTATYETSDGEVLTGPVVEGLASGDTATLFVRPEKVTLLETQTPGAVPGTVKDVIYLGGSTDYEVVLEHGATIVVRAENHRDGSALANPGEQVFVLIDPKATRVLKL
jgi:spermidine/putrescine transport system ATP-binding protein